MFWFAIEQAEFGVGARDKVYPGYRQMTRADLMDPECRQRWLTQHYQHSGWILLEQTVVVNASLCVAEGAILIVDSSVSAVDQKIGKTLFLRGVYAARTQKRGVAWTATPPPLDGAWSVDPYLISDAPCLFIVDRVDK
jgi:hypothetical protein